MRHLSKQIHLSRYFFGHAKQRHVERAALLVKAEPGARFRVALSDQLSVSGFDLAAARPVRCNVLPVLLVPDRPCGSDRRRHSGGGTVRRHGAHQDRDRLVGRAAQRRAHDGRRARRCGRPCSSSTSAAGPSRPTTCTTAGRISSTGIANWSLNSGFIRAGGSLALRRERRWLMFPGMVGF